MEVGAAASVLSIVDTAIRATSALVEYAATTKNASADRKLLADESQALIKLLEKLKSRTLSKGSSDETWLANQADLLRQFSRAYDDLATSLKLDTSSGELKPQSRKGAFWTVATWSFTKSEVYAVLERLARLQLYVNTLLLDDQHAAIEKINDRQEHAQINELRSTIIDWLTPLHMNNIHNAISKRPGAGSGRWFLTAQSFRSWQEGHTKLLWCPGIPGAGKTVMASIVFEYLRQQRTRKEILEKEITVVIIYLKYNDPQMTLENVLGSILRQLIQEDEEVPQAVTSLFQRHKSQNTSPSAPEFRETLLAVLAARKRNFLIVDALDECGEEMRWELIEILRTIEPYTQILLTSRFLENIAEELDNPEKLEIKAHKVDLELYIDRQILKNKNLRKLVEKSPSIRQDIKDAVVATAEHMFLLARLHVESLSSAAALSIKHVRKKLESLPSTLKETYDEAFSRIESQEPDHKNVALKTLAWTSYAFRPLSLSELQHALAIEPDSTELDDEDIMDGNNIIAVCAGLLIIDSGTNTVNLVHYTAKSYFETIRAIHFPGFHATITMSCATYLALSALKQADIWTIVRKYPLACYAAQHMGDHARSNPEDALDVTVLRVLFRLLSHPEKRKPLLSLLDSLDLIRSGFYMKKSSADVKEIAWDTTADEAAVNVDVNNDMVSKADDFGDGPEDASLLESLSEFTMCTSKPQNNDAVYSEVSEIVNRMPEVTALHLAASMGLARVASLIVEDSGNVDAIDETGKTALALAMERGFEKAVEFLVTSGAQIDLTTENGQNIFLLTTERDWHGVAKTIVAKFEGVDVNPSIQILLAAYCGDDAGITHAMTSASKDRGHLTIEAQRAALFVAVERGHSRVVQVLTGHGVDVNSQDSSGRSALHRATRRGHESLITLLLDRGADIDSQDDEGRTPWSSNLRAANKQTLDYLLGKGADPNTRGLQGVSELYIAAQNGETSLVKYMLESGTNSSIQTQFDWTPLHWAAYYGHVHCVKLLMEAGANLSAISDQDATPLDLAVRANQVGIVHLLSKAGAKASRDIEPSPQKPTDEREEDEKQVNAASSRSARSDSRLKVALTFDKPIQQGLLVGQFIYPTHSRFADNNIYHISHQLDKLALTLGIRLSDWRADMVEYPLAEDTFDATEQLYEVVRHSPDYQQLHLYGGKQSSKDRFDGMIKMVRDWTGGWKIRHHYNREAAVSDTGRGQDLSCAEESEYLFRTTPDWSKMKEEGCRWMTEDGKLLMRTGMEDVTPTLCFEAGVDKPMRDVLVSCWVAKLWSEAVALQKRERESPLQP